MTDRHDKHHHGFLWTIFHPFSFWIGVEQQRQERKTTRQDGSYRGLDPSSFSGDPKLDQRWLKATDEQFEADLAKGWGMRSKEAMRAGRAEALRRRASK